MPSQPFIPVRALISAMVLLLGVMLYAGAVVADGPPQLSGARALGDNRFELGGRFGPSCPTCEVIADYGQGLRYAYPATSWEPGRIELQLVDLNAGLEPALQVRNSAGLSTLQRVRLQRRILPAPELQQPVSATRVDNRTIFERSHQLAIGDKGEDSFDVSAPAPGCGQERAVFDHARLLYSQQRFGEAQIVQMPPAGCSQCSPLKVRWYHEPTGRLSYQLHVYRRMVEGICQERRR